MMSFRYFQPTEIRFGCGRIEEVGQVVAAHGKRCLLVSGPAASPALGPVYGRVKALLAGAGVEVAHFDGVTPNPTTDIVTSGSEMARAHRTDVVLGLGGGSSMDTAKAIAVEASHDGTAWDYLFYRQPQPDGRTLPIVTVSTTSGTGSQVTQVAVVTNTRDRDKSAIYNELIYPRASIIDPELMVSVPQHVTAATGFDVLAHSFESYLHPNASPHTDLMALEAIRLVVRHLPVALRTPADLAARVQLAWADTLAGLCIAAAGVTLPHGIGMAMGGLFPHIAHGEALAVVYPSVVEYSRDVAVDRLAVLARVIDSSLAELSDEDAAHACAPAVEQFLDRIHLRLRLGRLDVPRSELALLAHQSLVLPDYRNHPRVATENEVLDLLERSW